MMHRNTIRSPALAVIVALILVSASAIAGGSTQKRREQSASSLMTAADAIPDVAVVLKKKREVEPAGAPAPAPPSSAQSPPKAARASRPAVKREEPSAAKKKTNKDGSFSFENVPLGTYNLTFDAPKVSPAMAGRVEYLVIVQQVEAGGADNSATKTYDESKPKTARIPIAKIQDGLDFNVGPQPPANAFQASKPNVKNKAGVTDSQMRKPKEAMRSPQAMNLRGKIFLVEIGTTRIVRDQPVVKSPNQ